MNDLDLFEECEQVKKFIKALAAKYRYTKRGFGKNLDLLKETSFDLALVKDVFVAMSETDFCKIVDVDSCRGGKYSSCKCIKTIVFGDDDTELCDWFSVRATSKNRCEDGNLNLVRHCEVSSSAVPCDEFVARGEEQENLEKSNRELTRKLEKTKKELTKLCGKLGLDDDCFDYLDL